MKIDKETGSVTYTSEVYEESKRKLEAEDLMHLTDAIMELQQLTGAIALPGLEALHQQIALRLQRRAAL